MNKRVVILMGGTSGEREVSLRSGAAVAEAVRVLGYQVLPIDVAQDIAVKLGEFCSDTDVVFNALHGRYGEDGCVQGFCEVLGLAYTHSGVLASALAMNKPMSKRLFLNAGIPVPKGGVFSRQEILAREPMPRPYVVKPLDEGSSLGVHIVREGEESPVGDYTWSRDERVLVEDYVPGCELTVAIMKERSLEVLEIRPSKGFYDYDSKYTKGCAEYLIPAPVSDSTREEALHLALLAHQTLGCRGVTRSDFRYDGSEGGLGLRLLEINTQPGLTPTSLVPEIAAHVGIDFQMLVKWMLEDARCNV